ncbi:MAG: blaR0 [Phycisphaerales bacterium]|nr:blaR0 [Phycisphaerales bacterium]
MRRHLRTTLLFLALGLVTTLAVAWLLALLQDVQLGRQSQGSAFINEEQWSVTRWDRAGAIQIKSIRIKGASWSPQQAAGAPDTPTVGDQTSAWASQSSDAGTEWLILQYARAVVPRQVQVYENCAPGALFKVTIFDEADHEIEAWSGTDPTPSTPASSGSSVPVSTIPISLNIPTRKIKIYLACDKVPGWNEVDAVALVSDKGDLQWARQVQASSTYASSFGSNAGSGGNPELLVPGWTTLGSPARPMEAGLANREERQIDARGWPMVALMSEIDTLATGTANSTSVPPANSYKTLGTRVGSNSFAITTPSANHAPIPVPLRPIWIGLIGDTLLFATVWLAAWSTLVIPRRFIREVARFRRGACIQCGYDLGYDFIQGCPECGWRRDRPR